MANVFDYLSWRGDLTFAQAPFQAVDNLIVSCMAYVVLDGIVSGFDCPYSITVAEAAEMFVQLPEPVKNLRDVRDEQLLVAMAESRRFGGLELCCYVQQLDRETEKQFAAITVNLGNGSHYVAYRGTDKSIIGWKEDFNMTFCSGVPAQLEAVRYLQQVAARTTGPLYVGGHSKGGNLAAYAAAFVEKEIQQRIVTVYNNDGPGFLEDVVASPGYQAICGRLLTLIPQTSLIGMMLEHAEPFTVVQSQEHFVLQHDPYSWQVLGPAFCTQEQITSSSRFLDQTIRGWLAGLTTAQREQFVDTIFDLLVTDEMTTLQELRESWPRQAGKLRELDKEAAEMIGKTLALLVRNMGSSAQNLAWNSPVHRRLEQTISAHRWLRLPKKKL